MRFLILAALLVCLVGCAGSVETKTQDPDVIEKGRQAEIQNSHREMQRPAPPPGTPAVPAN